MNFFVFDEWKLLWWKTVLNDKSLYYICTGNVYIVTLVDLALILLAEFVLWLVFILEKQIWLSGKLCNQGKWFCEKLFYAELILDEK